MDINKYSFHVGTARGVLICTCGKPDDIKFAKHEDSSEVTSLISGRSENELLVGFHNGIVSLYDIEQCKFKKSLTKLEGEGRIAGLGCVNRNIYAGKHDGVINVWNGKYNNFFSINLDEKGTLDSMVCNSNRENIIGTGGEFNDFKLWNVETKQCVFKAKSLGHDELQLPIPTSIRGITFFTDEIHLSCCVTKEGHVLLYDDRAQRRPVVKYLEEKNSYTSISTAYRERQCLVGTTKGYMQLLDMRVGKSLKSFLGFTGSVTSIACDASEPYVASVSLDRHLRVHNLETKELLVKCYLKQNLTKVIMRPVVKEEPEDDKREDENVDKEYEEIFNNMEEVKSDKPVKKRKTKTRVVADEPKKRKKKVK